MSVSDFIRYTHPLRTIAMKMIFWKEFREQRLKVLLAAIVLFAVEVYGLGLHIDLQAENPQSFYGQSGLLTFSWLGCLLIGLAMALSQFLPEIYHRDHWATVLHLPVHRGKHILQRAAAGIFLCIVSMGIPLILAISLYFIPGVIAEPLTAKLPLGGMTDILFGITCYLATLHGILSSRGAFWRRGVAMGVMLPALVINVYLLWHTRDSLLQTAIWPIAIILLLGTACYGNALSQGASDNQPWFARAVNATLLPIALVIPVLLVSVTIVVIFALSTTHNTRSFWQPWREIPDYGYVRIRQRHENYKMKNEVIFKADGTTIKPTDDEAINLALSKRPLVIQAVCADLLNPEYGYNPYSLESDGYRNTDRYLRKIEFTAQDPQLLWYYIPDGKYFTGYDKKTRLIMGYMGKSGFVIKRSEVQPFERQDKLIVAASRCFMFNRFHIYEVNLNTRQVSLATASPKGNIVTVLPIYAFVDHDNTQFTDQYFFVFNDRIELNPSSTKPVIFRFDRELGEYRRLNISIGPMENNETNVYLHYSPTYIEPEQYYTSPDLVDKYDVKGVKTSSFTIPNARALPDELETRKNAAIPPFYLWASTLITPQFIMTPLALYRSNLWWHSEKLDLDDASGYIPSDYRDLISILLSGSLMLALIAWPIARRMGKSPLHTFGWMLNIYTFALAGFIAFLLSHKRGRKARCPQCGKNRSISTELCPHCKSPWPAPVRDGSEIFDEPATLALAEMSPSPASDPSQPENIAVS
ncbi:MAG TPA: zinc ribbon domain-containing protein [Candidatus Methylacidiphilales bacterium]|nr:zinc ribbon domain-containing protein [Candidatus Methylacidiphilales bacterium]